MSAIRSILGSHRASRIHDVQWNNDHLRGTLERPDEGSRHSRRLHQPQSFFPLLILPRSLSPNDVVVKALPSVSLVGVVAKPLRKQQRDSRFQTCLAPPGTPWTTIRGRITRAWVIKEPYVSTCIPWNNNHLCVARQQLCGGSPGPTSDFATGSQARNLQRCFFAKPKHKDFGFSIKPG